MEKGNSKEIGLTISSSEELLSYSYTLFTQKLNIVDL